MSKTNTVAEGRAAAERSARVFFWGSTITGAAFLLSLALSFIAGGDFEPYVLGDALFGASLAVISKIVIFAGALYVAFYFDRKMAMPITRLFFTELGKIMSQKTTGKFNAFRYIEFVGTTIKFVGLIAITSLISLWGGDITATYFAPPAVAALDNEAQAREAYVTTATKFEADALAKVETARDAAVEKAKGMVDEDVQKLANSKKKGHAWAKQIVSDATAAAAKPYATKVAEAEKKLAAARETAWKRYDAIEGEKTATAKARREASEKRNASLTAMFSWIGLICVGLGVVSIGTQAMGEVSDDVRAAQARKQQSDDFMQAQKQQRQYINP